MTDLEPVAPNISAALVAALGSMDEMRKDKTATVPTKAGGSYSYTYTDIASVLGYVRPILAANGLAIMQPATSDGNMVSVSTIFLHKSGESRELPPLSIACGRTPQEVGSAITYARRYSLLSALGLATEDDDGKAATKGTQTRQTPAKAKAAPKAAPKPGGPSERQTKNVMAMFGELGLTERGARLDRTSSIVGHDVGSWSDVSADEADQVIDALRRALDKPLRSVDTPPHPGEDA